MRTLILTSSTGGGHNMRASSFVHWTQEKLGAEAASEIQIHKVLENTHGLYRFGVGLYNRIQRHVPWAHHVYFNFLEVAGLHTSRGRLLGVERYRSILDHVRPQIIISTHGSLNHGFFEEARAHLGAENVRCATYCGEMFGGYGFSRHWVNPAADLFIGAVSETCEMARKLGMPAEKTRIGGFLLNPSFYRASLSPAERTTLLGGMGLDPARFTLLLSTGEHGAHNHLALLNAIHLQQPRNDLQIIALCGRDTGSLETVRRWAKEHPSFPVLPLPHSHMMHLLMQASDAIVARPGTGTTSEAIVSGCPIIFNNLGGFMPQEYITLQFAKRHEFITEIHRPANLPAILAQWARQPEEYARVKQRLIESRPSQHPTDVLRMVADLATDLPPSPPHASAPAGSLEERKRSERRADRDEPGWFAPTL